MVNGLVSNKSVLLSLVITPAEPFFHQYVENNEEVAATHFFEFEV